MQEGLFELQTPQPQSRFHVGLNFAGYLPEREVTCFEKWRDAAGHVMSIMREYADEDDDIAFDESSPDTTGYANYDEWIGSDDAPHMRATVEAILKDDPPVEPQDYTATVEDNSQRRVAFWLLGVMCTDEDTQLSK